MTGIQKVLKAAGGSPSAVAKAISTAAKPCKRQHVQYWMKQGYVPIAWVHRVSKMYGVSLQELNPAAYDVSEAAA